VVISNLKIGTSYFFTLLKEFAKENIRYPRLHWFQRTGFEFRKQNGEFEFVPTSGVKRIRGSSGYVSQNRVRKIQNGEASGIVIQESGSGKIVIQESR
jgi:hypothetical protein